MKLYFFSEMAHHEFPDGADLEYPSMRLEFPNTYYRRDLATDQGEDVPQTVEAPAPRRHTRRT